ncbi:MAG TPA: T9SS type A sorting domain-containing protein, partial [Flavisolibacter sp.]|nr:T9SS type A sorting domain-containing protein [Flavisolibacter sp.]
GKQYYSNIISLRTAGKEQKPQIFNSMVRNNALLVASPVACQYSIIDYSGRQLMSGSISRGSSSINISQLNTGAYMIRLVYGTEQNVEKFVKH